jgi:transposase InsO family protein
MASNNISDEEILRLWKSPSFEGAFRGSKKFTLLLKTNLNISVPESRVLRVLSQDPIFITHQRRRVKIKHRHFYLSHVGQVLQGDVAYMFSRNQFRYFLIVVECFSNRIYTKALKNKNSKTVALALREIFDQFHVPIEKFETDRCTKI